MKMINVIKIIYFFIFDYIIFLGSLNILINSSLTNMSASARTDADSLVTVATLESIETVLKSLRGRGFPIESKVAESLLVTIDDLLNNKVRGVVSG